MARDDSSVSAKSAKDKKINRWAVQAIRGMKPVGPTSALMFLKGSNGEKYAKRVPAEIRAAKLVALQEFSAGASPA